MDPAPNELMGYFISRRHLRCASECRRLSGLALYWLLQQRIPQRAFADAKQRSEVLHTYASTCSLCPD